MADTPNFYLNLFDTTKEEQSITEEYKYDTSYIGYTKQTSAMTYASSFFHQNGKVGDFLYDNGMFSTDIDLKAGTPIGIVVIEKGFIPNSPKGRIMSLYNMTKSLETQDKTSGDTTYFTCPTMGQYEYFSLLTPIGYTPYCGYAENGEIVETSSASTRSLFSDGNAVLATDSAITPYTNTDWVGYPIDTIHGLHVPTPPFAFYYDKNLDKRTYFVTPPITTDNGGNTDYQQMVYNDHIADCGIANAVTNGYERSNLMTSALSSGSTNWRTDTILPTDAIPFMLAPCMCARYTRGNREWYLPSVGELEFVAARMNLIDTQLEKVSPLSILDTTNHYWSSTVSQIATTSPWGNSVYTVDFGSCRLVKGDSIEGKINSSTSGTLCMVRAFSLF